MATTPHMKNGNTSSRHTGAYKTHSTQGCLDWQKQQHNKWQKHTSDRQHQNWKKQKHGSNSTRTSSTCWPTLQQEQQPHFLQTTPTWDWTRGIPTTWDKVCNAGRNKKHRIPHKAFEANIRHQQLWGVILQLGVWAREVGKRQQHPPTTPGQDCSLDEWNKRTTTTTATPHGWSGTNLHRHLSNHHGILQGNDSIRPLQ